MLICWLIYAGYLMLRRAIEEPAQRARLSAVVSIFGFVEVIIVCKAIDWFRTLHPAAGVEHSRRRRHVSPAWKRPFTGTGWHFPVWLRRW